MPLRLHKVPKRHLGDLIYALSASNNYMRLHEFTSYKSEDVEYLSYPPTKQSHVPHCPRTFSRYMGSFVWSSAAHERLFNNGQP